MLTILDGAQITQMFYALITWAGAGIVSFLAIRFILSYDHKIRELKKENEERKKEIDLLNTRLANINLEMEKQKAITQQWLFDLSSNISKSLADLHIKFTELKSRYFDDN